MYSVRHNEKQGKHVKQRQCYRNDANWKTEMNRSNVFGIYTWSSKFTCVCYTFHSLACVNQMLMKIYCIYIYILKDGLTRNSIVVWKFALTKLSHTHAFVRRKMRKINVSPITLPWNVIIFGKAITFLWIHVIIFSKFWCRKRTKLYSVAYASFISICLTQNAIFCCTYWWIKLHNHTTIDVSIYGGIATRCDL